MNTFLVHAFDISREASCIKCEKLAMGRSVEDKKSCGKNLHLMSFQYKLG